MNMKRILIVDDDSSVGTMLKFVIAREQLGEVVATVTDEEQAVDEILFYQPDIVLIDLLFPHTDGIRIMKRAMSRGAGSHFIMISQAHDKNMEEMAYKEGIDFFVHKPINVLEIRKVLQNVIQIMEMERMLSAVRQAVTPAAAGPAADDSEQRLRDFAGYQLTSSLLAAAKPDHMVLHCLPAHRGEEISTAVFEGHADEIFDEAENRLHVQKAVLAILLGGK